jgi:K(+)-stimulated pyrophosphate-energized sodium pump
METSKEVVKICTQYAQAGMFNIFVAIFSFALGVAFLSGYRDMSLPDINGQVDPLRYAAASFFVAYLISIAIFGLFQAVFMANAGGAWDNAKKVVEVDLKEKGTALHEATVVGDTVGDPFKDTSSVAMNPIIKFTTLFGLLAMEIAISANFYAVAPYIGFVFFAIALYFVYRSFFKMRIQKKA